ncbi:GNAT family N-acetyltransferase [Xaviernesmea oryzae]|uniref:GNAT family N-acetyltransferase n=1 Tax=Xaviernesmea oryzae TaxID=464029 RepID=A0A1Q9B038_9HYPH|nr:GNAT family N-acetyltransferase [Xaviernesmea oryzae]OLP61335.1 GNAT family N-acetyltransferase [Xaviernesmea oryzae]SEL55535.1 Protein N-acetyltransferase, RimJ/RimL family [Xaviernesmea oryzae]
MIITRTERLILRNWQDQDRDLFFTINSDPEVMAFFSSRRDRVQSDALFDLNRDRIADTGYGFYALALAPSDKAIGFCGLARADLAPLLSDDTIEIGWRLARPFWGQGYVTEAAERLLAYGFDERDLPEIVSFAVAHNARSIAVMRRIGLTQVPDGDFDHPRVLDSHPHLKRHVLYKMTAADYAARKAR